MNHLHASASLRKSLQSEIKKICDPDDTETDPDLAMLEAARRIAARIDSGETGLHDPLNPADEIILTLARIS